MKPRWYAFIALPLIGLAAASIAACGESHAESHPTTPATPAAAPSKAAADPIPVTLTAVVQLPSDAPLRVAGRVSHARDIKPAFKTGGVIKEILVDEGDRVTKGQVLARLDPREIDAGIAQARAAVAKADRDLKRVGALVDDAVLPGTIKDDAATALTVARAQLAGLAFNRETTTLIASADGVVVKRLAEPHEVIGPGMPVLVIGEGAADGTQIEVGVSARDLTRITLGATATVRLDGDTGDRPATVIEVAPTLTPGTDRIAVTLAIGGPALAHAAPRGLVGVATFGARDGAMLPAIPLTTLVEGLGQEATVWVVDGTNAGQVVAKKVTIARIRPDGMALIASGLDGVSEVIDAGNAWLDSAATVVIKMAAPTAGNTAPNHTKTAGASHEDR